MRPAIDTPAFYTTGTPVGDILEATAVIEVFRHKNDEKVCVSACVMIQGMVSVPILEDWLFEPSEKLLYDAAVLEACNGIADFYEDLPADIRAELEADVPQT